MDVLCNHPPACPGPACACVRACARTCLSVCLPPPARVCACLYVQSKPNEAKLVWEGVQRRVDVTAALVLLESPAAPVKARAIEALAAACRARPEHAVARIVESGQIQVRGAGRGRGGGVVGRPAIQMHVRARTYTLALTHSLTHSHTHSLTHSRARANARIRFFGFGANLHASRLDARVDFPAGRLRAHALTHARRVPSTRAPLLSSSAYSLADLTHLTHVSGWPAPHRTTPHRTTPPRHPPQRHAMPRPRRRSRPSCSLPTSSCSRRP
jgi:hypothetical protein